MASDSFASGGSKRSRALVRNTCCTSAAIGGASDRLPAMSINTNTARDPIANPSKKSPLQRSEWYRAFKSKPSSCGMLTGRGVEPVMPHGAPNAIEDETILFSRFQHSNCDKWLSKISWQTQHLENEDSAKFDCAVANLLKTRRFPSEPFLNSVKSMLQPEIRPFQRAPSDAPLLANRRA